MVLGGAAFRRQDQFWFRRDEIATLNVMNDTDAFFTHTIVGAPLSVLMGRRNQADNKSLHGVEIDLQTGEGRLSRMWHDWVVLNHTGDAVGRTRRRPGPIRRKLEHYALLIAMFGLISVTITVAYWGIVLWR